MVTAGGPVRPDRSGPVLVLVGLPAAGKTTAGRRVADRLGVEFRDSDVLVRERTGRTVSQIFAEDGEAAFRVVEADVVAEALRTFSGVLALGGGAVLSASTRAALAAADVPVVHLVTTAAAALRFVRSGRGRPLLEGDPARRLLELERDRSPLYHEVATFSVRSGNRSMAAVVNDLALLVAPAHVRPGPARRSPR